MAGGKKVIAPRRGTTRRTSFGRPSTRSRTQTEDPESETDGDAVMYDPASTVPRASDQNVAPMEIESVLEDLEDVEVEEPLDVGLSVRCKWRQDSLPHNAEILARRQKPGSEEWEYYVHYSQWNRRLDEWVDFDKFDIESLRIAILEKQKKDSQEIKSKQKEKKRKDLKRKRASEPRKEKTKKEKEKEEQTDITKIKNIQEIEVGEWTMDTWYYSPFPKEFLGYKKLYVCEFCLKFLRSPEASERHRVRCDLRHPPGIEIYRKGKISMFEVDGATNRFYAQNLCYIAKLFLDHKTLYYDVDPFWFYVMCEVDERGAHLAGYFSKEKKSEEDYNVACILTLPPFQRRGYGKFMMKLSYELSKLENRVGSPEKPLSDLGLLGYRSYWSQLLVQILKDENSSSTSIEQLMEKTMMKPEDITGTLQALNVVRYHGGSHVVDIRKIMNMNLGNLGLECDPSCIRWTPHSMGPGVQAVLAKATNTRR